MYNFSYHRPHSLVVAQSLLEEMDDPKLLGGGQTLLPTMKQRLAMPSDVIDLKDIPELQGVSVEESRIVIGAATTHAEVNQNPEIRTALPALSALAGGIGDPAVRHMGTLGGSIANNDPSADYPAACLALGATIITSKRELLADEFFVDMFETALDEQEIVLSVSFPIPEKAAYEKFANPTSRYALVGVFIAQFADEVRVAITGAAPSVFRSAAMEEVLKGDFTPSSIESVHIDSGALTSDLHASAEYRAHLIGVMAKRAIEKANG